MMNYHDLFLPFSGLRLMDGTSLKYLFIYRISDAWFPSTQVYL